MAITTAISASAAAANAIKGEPASPTASSSSNDTEAPKTNDAAASTPTLTGNTAPAGTPPKRRAARRANTAERRATHNAVERMRRETLNGQVLWTLASLLPPLAALRRPSKAAITILLARRPGARDMKPQRSGCPPSVASFLVLSPAYSRAPEEAPKAGRGEETFICTGPTSSRFIATVNAAARHRVLAAQTLRSLARESEQLRREVNEWRARARVPQLDVPVRSDAHNAEDGDEGDEPNDNHDNNNTEAASPVSPAGATPSPAAASRSSCTPPPRASSARGAGPRPVAQSFYTPSPIHTAMPMAPPRPHQQPLRVRRRRAARVAVVRELGERERGVGRPGDAAVERGDAHDAPRDDGRQGVRRVRGCGPGQAGAAYDLGLGFDGEEGLLFGGGASGVPMGHPAFHLAHAQAAHHLQAQQAQVQMQVQQQMRMREAYEQQAQLQAHLAMGGVHMGMPMGGMGVPVGRGAGAVSAPAGFGETVPPLQPYAPARIYSMLRDTPARSTRMPPPRTIPFIVQYPSSVYLASGVDQSGRLMGLPDFIPSIAPDRYARLLACTLPTPTPTSAAGPRCSRPRHAALAAQTP
ncbi:hypothetical protein B0H14DRAFT_3475791 [Mycena olivaceomarginata]|nr:hypothetical protein B0H14DRAFT_3475791 [Mycena olivaceomarginata]